MINYYDRIETASRDELFHLQSARLIKKLREVYENVPLYRQRMIESGVTPDDIRSVEDLPKLPFTTKQDLRDTYPYGMFAIPMKNIVRLHASSGTTGKQTVVGYTRNDLTMWGNCVARALTSAGATRDDIIHVAYGYGLFTGGLGIHYGIEQLGATVVPASTGNTTRQLTLLQDFQTTVLCATPSYALYLADTMQKNNIPLSNFRLRVGLFGAEPWTENMRKELEERLGIEAHDIYGLSEVCGPGVAFDCCAKHGLHVNEDNFIVEIVDPETGKPVPDGTQGEVVFTCMTKEALPLIRYNTHDISSITHEPCECGRTFVRLAKITGRSDDMLIIRGVNVFPSQVESVLLSIGNVDPHYLIIVDRQGNLDTMEIQVEISQSIFDDRGRVMENLGSRIKAAVESTLGIAAKITLVEPGTIERTDGKAKHVIDKRNLV